MWSFLEDKILYTHIFIAGCASLLTLNGEYISETNINYLVFVFFSTCVTYGSHRYLTAQFVPKMNWPQRYRRFFAQKNLNIFLFLTGLLACLITYLQLSMDIKRLLILPFILSILYVTPFKSMKGLRFLPFIKTIIVSLVWTLVTLYIPSEITGKSLDWIPLAERFIYIYALCLPFDIRDRDLDVQSGVKTLAQINYSPTNFHVSAFLLFLALLLAYWGPTNMGILMLYSTLIILLLLKGSWAENDYTLILDGSMGIYGLILIIT